MPSITDDGGAGSTTTEPPTVALDRVPRDNLVRLMPAGSAALRAESEEDGEQGDGRTMYGHFARTNEWAEIHSIFEGHFLERFAPGAFRKTLREGKDRIKVLFQHGFDPQIGDKPLGRNEMLREDDEGAYYEARLLDASYVEDVRVGLVENLYGASFRFSVIKDAWDNEPERSEHNPDGLPERTVREAAVAEYGPVTFPAYEGASAAVRSQTDDYLAAMLGADPDRLAALIEHLRGAGHLPTPPAEPAASHSEAEEPPAPAPAVVVTPAVRSAVRRLSRAEFISALEE